MREKDIEKVSCYIDELNQEKKPDNFEDDESSTELNKLYEAVRMVKSLKEPSVPERNFPRRLINNIKEQMIKNNTRKGKIKLISGLSAVAAVLILLIIVNFALPLNNTDIVYAMENAYHEINAYHGTLEIVQSSASGESTLQNKIEVWADKNGHYYSKVMEGFAKGLVTVNNGDEKWQIDNELKEIHVFPSFPDLYGFSFELGQEIKNVQNALSTKVVGEEEISGRQASIIKVTAEGGTPYRIWIDKETNLPLQKEISYNNVLQYKITYSNIDFVDYIPSSILELQKPHGYTIEDNESEQLVNNMDEAKKIIDFDFNIPDEAIGGYTLNSISVLPDGKIIKMYYEDKNNKQIVLSQGKSTGDLKAANNAILGEVNGNTVEIQEPVTEYTGILGGGIYGETTNINSIRWADNHLEYGVMGNTTVEELTDFIDGFTHNGFNISFPYSDLGPSIEVPVDMEVEENEQKSVDAGHSPWRLDPVYTAQVFVSLQISPEGITGDYPVKYENIIIIHNDGTRAVVRVDDVTSPVKSVYLEKLVRKDSTGIWTVVGYDPA